MSHHYGPEFFKQDISKFVNETGIGATGKFPDGKIDEKDQGQIMIGVTVKDGRVIMSFGKPTEWIGFTREEAIQIGQTLIDRARQVD